MCIGVLRKTLRVRRRQVDVGPCGETELASDLAAGQAERRNGMMRLVQNHGGALRIEVEYAFGNRHSLFSGLGDSDSRPFVGIMGRVAPVYFEKRGGQLFRLQQRVQVVDVQNAIVVAAQIAAYMQVRFAPVALEKDGRIERRQDMRNSISQWPQGPSRGNEPTPEERPAIVGESIGESVSLC